jgi:uncharacterized protein (DUF1697 family)
VTTYVALLRGINVGGRHRLAMADLRELCTDAGCEGVTTYIQSGNVVFRHRARSPGKLAADLAARLEAMTGFTVAVVLRTAAQMAAVVDDNPFPRVPPTELHVTFLSSDAPPGALDGVDPAPFAPDRFVLHGRQIYLHLPHGMARTKLPQALDVFPTPVTTRNWKTVLKLVELSSG